MQKGETEQPVITRVIRNCVGLLLWLLADGGLLALNVAMVLANYLACKGSFELLGFKMRPLGTDELVGGFFGAFFHKATLAHFTGTCTCSGIARSPAPWGSRIRQ